jgi:F0F1-type ATP synthase assembly protein I
MERGFFQYLMLVTQIGLAIASGAIIGVLLGVFLDKKLNLNGVFTVVFLVFGLIGGFKAAYESIKKLQDRDTDARG